MLAITKRAKHAEPVHGNSDGYDDPILNAISASQAMIEFEPDGTIITANKNFLNAMG